MKNVECERCCNAVMGLYIYVTGQMGRNNQNKGGEANLSSTEIPWLFYFKNESSLLLGNLHLPEVDNNYLVHFE